MDMVNKWITNNNINNVKKSKYINNGRSFVTENETSKNDHCLLAYDIKPQSIDMKTTALNIPVYLQVWEIQAESLDELNEPLKQTLWGISFVWWCLLSSGSKSSPAAHTIKARPYGETHPSSWTQVCSILWTPWTMRPESAPPTQSTALTAACHSV